MKKIQKVILGLALFIVCQTLIYLFVTSSDSSDSTIRNDVPHKHIPAKFRLADKKTDNEADKMGKEDVLYPASQKLIKIGLTAGQVRLLLGKVGMKAESVLPDSTITCDSGVEYPLSYLNDDYCDCCDGSDEWMGLTQCKDSC